MTWRKHFPPPLDPGCGRMLAVLREAAERSVEGLESGAKLSAVERS